jgi:integrase
MLIYSDGYRTMTVKHLKMNRLGVWYYNRRVPSDLRAHYGGRHIVRSLKTKDPIEAGKRATAMARADDSLWSFMRSTHADLTPRETRAAGEALLAKLGYSVGERVTSKHYGPEALDEHLERRYGHEFASARHEGDGDPMEFLNGVEREVVHLLNVDPAKPRQVLLSDALERYLRDHTKGSLAKFARDTSRAINIVIETVGDLPLEAITRDNARTVLETLMVDKATGTVKRQLAIMKAVVNHGLREFSLDARNHFEGLTIKGLGDDVKQRIAFNHNELITIANACEHLDDDLRWIIAMQMDLGTRIEEVVGMRIADVDITSATPCVHIRPHHDLGRSLKTKGSNRRVPLVGMALWGAQRALKYPSATGWLFPRYTHEGRLKEGANAASKTLNTWLKKITKTGKTTHSFRHSMKERLMDADVSEQMQRQIMGHSGGGAASGYGRGFSLAKLREAMEKVVIQH